MATKTSKGTTVSDEDALNVIDAAVSTGVEKLKIRFAAKVDTEGARLMSDFSKSILGHVVEVTEKFQQGVEEQDFTVMPIGTRFFQRKNQLADGGVIRTCTLLIEQTPQVRVCSFRRDASMDDNEAAAAAGEHRTSVDRYSLAFPFVLFAFSFRLDENNTVMGTPQVSTGFTLKPVTSHDNKVYRSLLPNADKETGRLCMGTVPAPDAGQSLADYVHEFVRTYWQSTWTKDYNEELVRVQKNDPRFANLGTWEQNSVTNSTFVLKNKTGPYGSTYKLASQSIKEWLKIYEIEDLTPGSAKAEGKRIENLMRKEVDALVLGFGRAISEIEISELHHPAHQVRVLKQFLEDFLGQATVEMRRLYEGRLVDQLRDLEKRLSRNAKEALADSNAVFDPENDMVSPW